MIFKHNKRYEKTLDNGMRLIYDYIPKSEITQIGCLINAGSIDEYGINVPSGTAHFIEHMVFNGAKRYTKEELNSVREAGGSINAYTGHDCTCFYESFLTENIEKNISMFIGMVFEPLFSLDEIEKERGIIKHEIKRSKDDPNSVHFNAIQKGFYNKFFKRPILGTMESIDKIGLDDLKFFHWKFYRYNNSILYISSSIPLFYLITLLKSAFQLIDMSNLRIDTEFKMPKYKNLYSRYWSKNIKTKFNTSIISFTYVIPKEEYYKLVLIEDIYTNGIGSILWNELREKKSLCYQFYGYIEFTRKDSKNLIFRLCVTCSKDKFDEISNVINTAFSDIVFINQYLTKCRIQSAFKRKYFNYAMQKINPVGDFTQILSKANIGLEINKSKVIDELKKCADEKILKDFLTKFESPYIVKTIEK